jgi:hypothetical protein
MRSNVQAICGAGLLLLGVAMNPSRVDGANAYPLDTDPNQDGLAFGGTDVFEFGAYALDVNAQLNGNDIVSYIQNFSGPCCHGAGFSVPVSNGENGIDQSFDGAQNQDLNPDVPNTAPVNSVFTTIGNPSGKLENGNVIRFSAWYRKDPANPIAVDPQIQPVLKFEFWKEALSTNQDTAGGALQPLFGDKVFDQDQHGGALGIPVADKAQWIDFNGDGVVIDGAAAGEGRVSQISTGAWTLVESQYIVNDGDWLGIGDDPYTVADIEEVRAVMFLGDFAGNNLTGDGDGGNLLVDNILVEVFRNAGSVTANTNPDPALSEGLDGDFNGDGNVDAADYVAWRKNDGTPGGYDEFVRNFGAMSPGRGGGALSTSGVPEPSTLGMLVLLVSFVLAGRARR